MTVWEVAKPRPDLDLSQKKKKCESTDYESLWGIETKKNQKKGTAEQQDSLVQRTQARYSGGARKRRRLCLERQGIVREAPTQDSRRKVDLRAAASQSAD